MSRGHGLRKLTGGIAKRERDEWERLAAGWTCALPTCDQPGVALIHDWTGTGLPVCKPHAEQARRYGRKPDYPPLDNDSSDVYCLCGTEGPSERRR